MLSLYKLIQGNDDLDLGYLAFKFDKSERTIDRDLNDLQKIFPHLKIGLKNGNYSSVRRTASPTIVKKVLDVGNNIRRNEFQVRMKTLADFVKVFTDLQPIQVDIYCSKYKLSKRTLSRYIKLIREVYDHWNIKYNNEKGYYLI
jgi:predicted DNA-binding transcriptional regulator YafY